MRTLLVALNAKYIHSNPAIYNLRAYCRKHKDCIELAEYTINHYVEDILMDIYKKKPQWIGFSCYIWNIGMICELGREIHKLLPDVPIWLGGPEVSHDSASFLEKETWATGIMRGEGEQIFAEVMDFYQEGLGSLSHIAGLIYRQEQQIVVNEAAPIMNLSEVPFIYEDLSGFEQRILYYETSRGCPFSCSYCLSSIDKRVRFRDMELVKKELQFFLNHNVKQVKFVDRTFNCKKEHSMAIWQYIRDHDNGITNFHFEIAADLMDQEEIDLLLTMRPGLVQLEIGVQTVNPVTIKEIKRKMDLEKVEQVVSRIRRGNNVHQHLDLIAGLPYEDYESFCTSFNRVYQMKPDQLQLGFLKVLKGSYMHDMAKEYGIVYRDCAPYEVLYTKWITFEEIMRLKAVEQMVEIYYNSDQFGHTLEYAVSLWKTPFDFYRELAAYYESRNLQMISHSRVRRYEILLDFLTQSHEDQVTTIRELLTIDLYARENMKSRPAWAKDLSPYRDRIQQFYKKEAAEHVYLKDYEGYNGRQLAGMTHVEVLEDSVILFDYKRRNPKNKEAVMHRIELDSAL